MATTIKSKIADVEAQSRFLVRALAPLENDR
jgi:hypothetical protein